MPFKAYWATNLGSGTGGLKKIDGAILNDMDMAIVVDSTDRVTIYWLDDDDGGSESSPDKIQPDTNAGTKMWILLFPGPPSFIEGLLLGGM